MNKIEFIILVCSALKLGNNNRNKNSPKTKIVRNIIEKIKTNIL